MSKRITFLNLHLGFGGIESTTINTANSLCDKFEVEIIAFYNLPENQSKFLNNKIKVKYLFEGKPNKNEIKEAIESKNIIKILKELFKAIKILYKKNILIKKEIRNCQSDIIVSTRWDFSIKLSKYKPKKTLAIAQEHHHHNNNKKYIKVLQKKYKNIDYIFALTSSLEEDYKKFLKNNKNTKVVLMPNMISDINTKKSDLSTKHIISVGRLHEGKRINELIDIVSKCKNIEKFYIIGNGEEYLNLKKQIQELKLNKKIELLGYMDHERIQAYLSNSSIFVMASISEGLPMVLLEAMNNGVPCIAYETDSGINDIIEDGKNGYVIKNRNEKDFITKLDGLLNDKETLKKFGKNAIKKTKTFSKENIVKRWEEIIMSNNKNLMKELFDKTYKDSKINFLQIIKNNIQKDKKMFIVTANPEAFMIAEKNNNYMRMLLDKDTTIIADGIGLVKAGKIMGYNIKERIPGVDIAKNLLEYAHQFKKKIYLFGSKEEVITKMKNLIENKYYNAELVGLKNGYEKDKEKVFEDIAKKEPDVILVALGMPLQEELIYKNLNKFSKGVFVGVGGSFDVISGTKKRAPRIFIKLNLEWLYRIICEPKRIKRFWNNNVKFIFDIYRKK